MKFVEQYVEFCTMPEIMDSVYRAANDDAFQQHRGGGFLHAVSPTALMVQRKTVESRGRIQGFRQTPKVVGKICLPEMEGFIASSGLFDPKTAMLATCRGLVGGGGGAAFRLILRLWPLRHGQSSK